MKKIFYNKLICDKIPEKIHSLGSECETLELSQVEFEKELIKKVSEEASGLLAAKSDQEILEEMADIADVLDEILKVKKISREQLIGQQQKNFEKKGAFEKKLYLVWSSDDKYKTNERKGNE